MSKLTPLESAVIKKLLDGKDDVLAVLRQQLEYAEVTQREVTGVGFYSTLAVPDSVGRAPRSLTVKFGDVHADMVHLRNGAGFSLYLRDGCRIYWKATPTTNHGLKKSQDLNCVMIAAKLATSIGCERCCIASDYSARRHS